MPIRQTIALLFLLTLLASAGFAQCDRPFCSTVIPATAATASISSGNLGSTSFRVEARLHGQNWSATSTVNTIFSVGGYGLSYLGGSGIYNALFFTGADSASAGYGNCDVALGSSPPADLIVRIDRDLVNSQVRGEVFNTVTGAQVGITCVYPITSLATGGTILSAGDRLGGAGASALGGSIAFLRWYNSSVPAGTPPAVGISTPATLGDWEFDNSPLDTSGNGRGFSGITSYTNTPVYEPACVAGAAQTVRIGGALSLNGTGSNPLDGGTTLTYAWSYIAGSDGVNRNPALTGAGTATPAVSGLNQFGSANFQLIVTDGSGNSSTCAVHDGVVAADGNGVINLTSEGLDPVSQKLIGPLIMYGANRWPWADTIHKAEMDLQIYNSANYYTPFWRTAQSGTISVTAGSATITGTGTDLTGPCAGGRVPLNGAEIFLIYPGTDGLTHYTQAQVLSCTDASHLSMSFPQGYGPYPTGTPQTPLPVCASTCTGWGWSWGYYGDTTHSPQYQYGNWLFNGLPGNYYDNAKAFYALYLRSGIDTYLTAFQNLADEWWEFPVMDQGYSCNAGHSTCWAPGAWRSMSLNGVVLRALEEGSGSSKWGGLWVVAQLAQAYMGNVSASAIPAAIDGREAGYAVSMVAYCALADPNPAHSASCRATLQSMTSAWTRFRTPGLGIWGDFLLTSTVPPNQASSIATLGGTGSVCLVHGSATVIGTGTSWSSTLTGYNIWFFGGNPSAFPPNNSAGDSVAYGVTINNAANLTLTSPYAGATACTGTSGSNAGYVFGYQEGVGGPNPTNGLVGWGVLPYMEGILGTGFGWAAMAMDGYDAPTAALYRSFLDDIVQWLITYGVDPPPQGGVYYGSMFIGCVPPIAMTNVACNSGTPSQARTDSLDVMRAFAMDFQNTGNPLVQSTADTFMSQMFSKPGTGGPNPDGYYISDFDAPGGFTSGAPPLGSAPKWAGQLCGFEEACDMWPAVRSQLSSQTTSTMSCSTLAITTLNPAVATAGGSAFTLTVNGTGFVSASVILWNGTALTTAYASATQLTAAVPANLIVNAGAATVTVGNPSCGTSNGTTFSVTTPPITRLSLSTATAGGPAFSLTVNGSGFLSVSTVQWNGSALPTTYVSSSQLTAAVPASLIAAPGSASVTVLDPGGITSNALTFTIKGPAPSLLSLSPISATAGGSAFSLTVNGSGFLSVSTVQWNGSALPTTYVSGSQLTAAMPASLIAAPGSASVIVLDPGGITSNALAFTIKGPAPSLLSLSPISATAGGPAFSLTVNGSGFLSVSTVQWNGSALPTTYVSGSQLTAAVPASLIAAPGSASVIVLDPGGITSNALSFTIIGPAPSLLSLSPISATAGGPAFSLTVNGSGFLSGSTVQWNGSALPTTYVSSSQLTAALPASLIAAPGGASVIVLDPGGITSNALTFTINGPAPSLLSLSPISATAGGPAFSLTVNGSGFLSGSTVQWNGSALPTAFVSATQLTASIAASLIANTGNAGIVVVNDVLNPGGTSSNTVTFPIDLSSAAGPVITSVSPSPASAGSPTVTVTITGTGLASGSVAQWNGLSLVTTYVSSTTLTAQIPAGDLVNQGTGQITVANPTGPASNSFPFIVSSGSPLQLLTVTPCRIMDTRNANGTFGGPYIAGGTSRAIPIPSSACGVPVNAAAYSLNFTVVPRTGKLGSLTVWPMGTAQPTVSTLTSPDGSVLADAALVPAGTAGSLTAYSTDDTDLVIDINGYFVPPSMGTLQFYPLPPCRVLDTRNANGTFGGPSLAGGGTGRSFPIVSSPCGAPANAAAYSFNVTVVPQGPLGYLTAWPTGQTQPYVSTMNSYDGTVLANAAIVPAGTDGAVSFYASNPTDLVIDINGYFAPPGSGGLNFYTAPPCRLVNTQNASGTFGGPIVGADATRSFPLSQGSCGLPSYPAGQAYSLTMTVTPQGGPLSYLTTWPTGGTQPFVSTLNAYKGLPVANAALVPSGTGSSINVFVTNTTDLIIDTAGYFGP